ncbi:hypothetical protein [Parasphingorhabdus cellanae]|uniref:Capsule polysaccharide biosynthesis protein n=1 Tax=Parasphingorhabdus cellanae TaxID=2806553 RepID=A0ABX7T384_9SPHN|nr:hypothetical protein [Parasphingorhabdus cellanae]QTD55413.1 hypothetical protein J4G78_14555 [Parasphingorhabdus cellanae]
MADQRRRILFYLPVITPWWFANIAVHLIRTIARTEEVHVLVPPLWCNTGLGEEQLDLIADLDHVRWYVLDGPDHPRLRTDASAEDDLLELVRDIDPDFVLCRSADIITPARFPGTIRYMMEGAAPPFQTGNNWITLAPSLFDHGLIPTLSPEDTAILDQLAGSLWAQMLSHTQLPSRNAFLAATNLPDDKTVIALPLEYEHEENFFGQHHRYDSNAAMIEALAAALNDDTILAVTNHPLNELYGDNRAVKAVISEQKDRVVMLKTTQETGPITLALSQYCDGMIVGNSKSWSACAAFGTPLLRLSDFASGTWLQAYDNLSEFLTDIAAGNCKLPDPVSVRRWFAFHLSNCVFDPADPALNADDIISRMTQPVDPERWHPAAARFRAQPLAHVA